MQHEQKLKIFRQLMWDYNISAENVEAVFNDSAINTGHYTKNTLFIKLLENYPWFTIVQLFTIDDIKQMLTDDVINKLRFKTLRTKYNYVQKRLQ